MGYYVHDVPGRLRVKIPALKRNDDTAREIRRIIEAIEGIDSSAVNTLTGSVLVNYDSRSLNAERILHSLTKNGYFDASQPSSREDHLQAAVSKASGLIGKALIGLILDKALEGSAVSFLTVLI